jgi:hypothetical protein
MGKLTGFMEFKRLSEASLPVADRRRPTTSSCCI